MGRLAALLARHAARQALARLEARSRRNRTLVLLALGGLPVAVVLAVVLLVVLVLVALFVGANSGGCGTSAPTVIPPGPSVSNPASLTQRQGAFVKYLESQEISANGAAGIVGNLTQESSLITTGYVSGVGGGLAGWQPEWYATMASYARSQGLSPTSAQGQLAYIVYDLRTTYAPLLVELNKAPDPQTAARAWETIYEKCSGVIGPMQVLQNSLCNDQNRRAQAVSALHAAGGATTAIPAAAVTLGQCVLTGSLHGGKDPIPSPPWRQSRDDAGVDACATQPQAPIYAPVDMRLVLVFANWYRGQPLMLFKFAQPQAGTPFGDQYIYVAEQITPETTAQGTMFRAGSVIARWASSGSCIEIGWGSPSGGSWTLAGNHGDPGALHPPRGATTMWAESFKRYFGFPKSWIGTSP